MFAKNNSNAFWILLGKKFFLLNLILKQNNFFIVYYYDSVLSYGNYYELENPTPW